jgi:hypothetical protein
MRRTPVLGIEPGAAPKIGVFAHPPIGPMSSKPFELRPSEFIEFESVAIESVPETPKAPVDDTIDADPLSINFERKKDFKPTSAERVLAGETIDWLVSFAPDARPKALCERYAHVANRLAKQWRDKPRSGQSLTALVSDPRWGTAGYPAQVQDELSRLLKIVASA